VGKGNYSGLRLPTPSEHYLKITFPIKTANLKKYFRKEKNKTATVRVRPHHPAAGHIACKKESAAALVSNFSAPRAAQARSIGEKSGSPKKVHNEERGESEGNLLTQNSTTRWHQILELKKFA